MINGKDFFSYVFAILTGFCLTSLPAEGQSKADSLLKSLAVSLPDTQRIVILNKLAWEIRGANPDTSIILSIQARSLAEPLSRSGNAFIARAGQRGVAMAYKQIGVFQQLKGDNNRALENDFIALDLFKKLGDREGEERATNNIGIIYVQQGNYAAGLEQYNKALKIAEEIGNKLDVGRYLGNIGAVYVEQGDYTKGLEVYFRALKMDKANDNRRGIAVNLGNIALAYSDLGNFPLAIDYAFQALKQDEVINDKIGYALMLGNIGYLYQEQQDTAKALEYNKKALELDRKLGIKLEIARMLSNIGQLYADQKKFALALQYYFLSLQINEEMGNKHQIDQCMRGIGQMHENQGDSAQEKGNSIYSFKLKYPLARLYYNQALDIALQTEDKPSLANCYAYIGSLDMKQSLFPEAESMILKALAIADSIGDRLIQQVQHRTLSDLYEKLGKSDLSLLHFKRYSEIKDSLFTADKSKEITRKEMNYEFDKKEEIQKAEQDRKDMLNAAEKRRHLLAIYSGSAVVLLLFILAVLIYRSNLQKQKANIVLERKNQIIEKQKEVVEEQNKNILDSIHYAKRLQDAILPSELFYPSEVKEHFVFFSPKDVVSGDFYWRYDTADDLFFAVVDCTGHGVPGAMMSILAYDILQAALKDMGLREPDEILQMVNDQIIEKLHKSNTGGTQDGMDLTLCRLNKASRKLTFSGAKNELWIASGENITIYTVDKVSIGDKADLRFSKSDVVIRENDVVYLFTDGYADQKGGAENKKFMRSKFRVLLSKISSLPCEKQQICLENEFEFWKGNSRQRDDVLVVGFRVGI